jgi:hypothetical protein
MKYLHSFILFEGQRLKHFFQVTSACKADILAVADILLFVTHLAVLTRKKCTSLFCRCEEKKLYNIDLRSARPSDQLKSRCVEFTFWRPPIPGSGIVS